MSPLRLAETERAEQRSAQKDIVEWHQRQSVARERLLAFQSEFGFLYHPFRGSVFWWILVEGEQNAAVGCIFVLRKCRSVGSAKCSPLACR
jgi:hypothetical protein